MSSREQFWYYITCNACDGKLGVKNVEVNIDDAGLAYIAKGRLVICPGCRHIHKSGDIVQYNIMEEQA